jgi:glycosyltransferase involved in cell wall biosynthesis
VTPEASAGLFLACPLHQPLFYQSRYAFVSPHVVVLLATRNGERFLDEQIASLQAQDVGHVDIYASDDGSTDRTLMLLEAWASRWGKGKFAVSTGPQKGFSENFRTLATAPGLEADYVAFCDQDDIWEAGKLSAAITALSVGAPDQPSVYFSRTLLVDEAGREIGKSHLFAHPPSFRNALVQSIGGGNTMVFNRSGFALYAQSARRGPFLFHDWWGYLIVSGAGGGVHYDPVPHVRYRQHGGNELGGEMGLAIRLRRLRSHFAGGLTRWDDANVASLDACSDLLTADAKEVLACFRKVREKRGLDALLCLMESGIRRQTVMGNASLALAAASGAL